MGLGNAFSQLSNTIFPGYNAVFIILAYFAIELIRKFPCAIYRSIDTELNQHLIKIENFKIQ
jgi:hypothetical protein